MSSPGMTWHALGRARSKDWLMDWPLTGYRDILLFYSITVRLQFKIVNFPPAFVKEVSCSSLVADTIWVSTHVLHLAHFPEEVGQTTHEDRRRPALVIITFGGYSLYTILLRKLTPIIGGVTTYIYHTLSNKTYQQPFVILAITIQGI
jgi:hypothetical protein